MSYKSNIKIDILRGFPIETTLYGHHDSKAPLVIFSHGFKGFKDWGGFPYMLRRISEGGFTAAGFNFSFNGVDREHPTEFTRPDLFAQNTFTRELNDLESVIDHFYTNADEYNIDKEKIALIGHSRGGGISIIKAGEHKKIKCLITLASVAFFDRYSDEHKMKWKEKGFFEVLNTRTNQMMRLNVTLLEDLEKNRKRLDIRTAVKKLGKPFLIIHGKEDLSVRFEEAVELYRISDKSMTEIFPIENTGHTFGIVHPFEGTTRAFDKVIEKVIGFLSLNLRDSAEPNPQEA